MRDVVGIGEDHFQLELVGELERRFDVARPPGVHDHRLATVDDRNERFEKHVAIESAHIRIF